MLIETSEWHVHELIRRRFVLCTKQRHRLGRGVQIVSRKNRSFEYLYTRNTFIWNTREIFISRETFRASVTHGNTDRCTPGNCWIIYECNWWRVIRREKDKVSSVARFSVSRQPSAWPFMRTCLAVRKFDGRFEADEGKMREYFSDFQ